jgi:hypothetical protein
MDQQNISEVLAKLRQPPVFTPAPPRPRRPPGRLRLDRDPHAPVHSSQTIVRDIRLVSCLQTTNNCRAEQRFRFWTRFIQATATPVNGIHDHVRRLHL